MEKSKAEHSTAQLSKAEQSRAEQSRAAQVPGRRGRRTQRQEQALVRNAAYQALTLDQKIARQLEGGHSGKQLDKLCAPPPSKHKGAKHGKDQS
jgi:hypothetical protein